MRFVAITIVTVVGELMTLAIGKPVPSRREGGIAIPLTRYSSFLDSNTSVDLDTVTSHGISVRERILGSLGNYEANTGTIHPFAVKWTESRLGERGASLPLAAYGRDLWMGEISIGTPPKTVMVQIDTGSTDMWVLQTGCAGISPDRDLWDPDSSKSAKQQQMQFEIKYTDGTIVRGERYSDNVTIAGFTADPQAFGSASSYTSRVQNNGNANGLLGLAFPALSRLAAAPLFVTLVSQYKLINPTFSLRLGSAGAEMYVGGANSMLYKGDITYTRVTHRAFWQVSMDDVRINGNKILENVPAMFDTGANLIYGDWERVSELYKHLGGTLMETKGFGYYHLPCDSFPTLSFTFGGRSFEMAPETLKREPIVGGSPDCFSIIVATKSPMKLWIIGTPFLQNFYSVFDYIGLQVGLADLA